MHGFSLNVDPDLSFFGAVRPCGLEAGEVGAMARHLRAPPALGEVADAAGRCFGRRFDRETRWVGADELGRRIGELRRAARPDGGES